jgi:succinate dehydrogenase / fumarate reductase membrane anchor subunit
MVVYIGALLFVLLSTKPVTYGAWRDLFAQGWMRVATLLFVFSLAWHAWVGVRDILMDYIQPTAVRLSLQVLTLVLLAVYIGWTVQILWR